MIFRVHIPRFPLNGFVESFIYYEGFTPEHNIERFLPDGNTEIIIDLTNQPKYIYDNQTLAEKQACRNYWVSGVRTQYINIPSAKESRMFIFNFKKGKAYAFYASPMNELTDHVVDADILLGNAIAEVREQMLYAKNINSMFVIAERFLLRSKTNLIESTANKCINYAVSAIVQQPDIVRLEALNRQVGYSQKHFINLFKQQVGVTPKTYLKIMRFQKAIVEIENKEKVNWGAIAFESGYYDHAHFIKDFKQFSGFTPNEYLQLKINDSLNYVPVG